jgi:hypothetical protein
MDVAEGSRGQQGGGRKPKETGNITANRDSSKGLADGLGTRSSLVTGILGQESAELDLVHSLRSEKRSRDE